MVELNSCKGSQKPNLTGISVWLWGLKYWNLEPFVKQHMFWVLAIGVFLGIIPESGPPLIFVMMYSQGLVPFSVLFTTSFVQDGHGMLPLLSYSLKDSILIKLFNLIFGLLVGDILFDLGCEIRA